MRSITRTVPVLLFPWVFQVWSASADSPPPLPAGSEKVIGAWDLTVTGTDGVKYPSWIEIGVGPVSLMGRICARVGSAHPLKRVEWDGKEFLFSETVRGKNGDKVEKIYKAKLAQGRQPHLQGQVTVDGESESFVAVRSPELKPPANVKWGKEVDLLAKGLLGWHYRSKEHSDCWTLADGVLVNKKPCVDIVSNGKYKNFRLHAEFNLGEAGANSGIYLRGRHEVQINDDAGKPTESHNTGGLYGLLTPSKNAAKTVGEWQSADITLLGREVTIVLNGETIIDKQNIPGPTGGALDSDEAAPGPVLLQGDHGVVSFRNVKLTPAL